MILVFHYKKKTNTEIKILDIILVFPIYYFQIFVTCYSFDDLHDKVILYIPIVNIYNVIFN